MGGGLGLAASADVVLATPALLVRPAGGPDRPARPPAPSVPPRAASASRGRASSPWEGRPWGPRRPCAWDWWTRWWTTWRAAAARYARALPRAWTPARSRRSSGWWPTTSRSAPSYAAGRQRRGASRLAASPRDRAPASGGSWRASRRGWRPASHDQAGLCGQGPRGHRRHPRDRPGHRPGGRAAGGPRGVLRPGGRRPRPPRWRRPAAAIAGEGRTLAVRADVSRERDVAALFEATLAAVRPRGRRHQQRGHQHLCPASSRTPTSEWDRVTATNLTGPAPGLAADWSRTLPQHGPAGRDRDHRLRGRRTGPGPTPATPPRKGALLGPHPRAGGGVRGRRASGRTSWWRAGSRRSSPSELPERTRRLWREVCPAQRPATPAEVARRGRSSWPPTAPATSTARPSTPPPASASSPYDPSRPARPRRPRHRRHPGPGQGHRPGVRPPRRQPSCSRTAGAARTRTPSSTSSAARERAARGSWSPTPATPRPTRELMAGIAPAATGAST